MCLDDPLAAGECGGAHHLEVELCILVAELSKQTYGESNCETIVSLLNMRIISLRDLAIYHSSL